MVNIVENGSDVHFSLLDNRRENLTLPSLNPISGVENSAAGKTFFDCSLAQGRWLFLKADSMLMEFLRCTS